jgi:16S rRNA (guanine527-N7)-methyltransferase
MNQQQKLQQACVELKLDLNDRQQEQLLTLMEQIAKWGKVFNLTSVVAPDQMLSVHLFDCLALVAQLRQRYGSRLKGSSLQMLDVGSGAGLPGLILAICSDPARLAISVTSVDTVEKKIAFQRQQKLLLKLDHFYPIHSRVEVLSLLDITLLQLSDARLDSSNSAKNIPNKSTTAKSTIDDSNANSDTNNSNPLFVGFDLITCRAFASLDDFCNTSIHLLSPTSAIVERFVAMKAKLQAAEIQALPATVQLIEQQPLQVPGLADAQRCLVWLATADNNKKDA